MSRRRPVAERSESGGLILRFDDVLLVRSSRRTWLLDLQTHAGGAQRHLQVPIGRHKVFDRLGVGLLRADAGQSPVIRGESQE